MDAVALNTLGKFATGEADDSWSRFLRGQAPEEPTPLFDESQLVGLHERAKVAFVDEVLESCGDSENARLWAFHVLDAERLDEEIAKVASVVVGGSPLVCDFAGDLARGAVTEENALEQVHHLAKVAFVTELREIIGDDHLLKEALALIDEDALDRRIAEEAMGLEKDAFLGALGGALGGLARRGAGAAIQGVGKAIRRSGAAGRATAFRRASKHIGGGMAMQAPRNKPSGALGPVGAMMRQPGPIKKQIGKVRQDYGHRRLTQLAEGQGPGMRRIGLGDRLIRRGEALSASGKVGRRPAPAQAASAEVPAPAQAASAEVPAPAPAAPAPAARAEVPAPAARAEGVDPATLASEVVDAPASGDEGALAALNRWFANASPLERAMAIGGPALLGEAALD